MQRAIRSLFVILGSMTAIAHAKPLPATEHQPPLALNLPSLWINLASHDDGYVINAQLRVIGATSMSDRLRFEWKSGGKLVATGKCQTGYQNNVLDGNCSIDNNIKATGPITVDVIYSDDQQDKDYLVTTLKTDVKKWPGVGKFSYWGIIPDDLLSVAFAFLSEDRNTFHKPLFQFWSTADVLGKGDPTLRCMVDGKRLPDFRADIDNPHGMDQYQIESSFMNPKARRTYRFNHFEVRPEFHFGKKEDHDLYNPDQMKWMIDNPGKWDCFVRVNGKPLREFLFTVNKEGMLEPSEMQKGKHPIPTVSNVMLVDMKIPKDNGVETRIRPEAMKKSIGFGLPWPDGTTVKEIQASFPPASGLPD